MKRMRRRNAGSSAALHVGRQDRQAAVRLHALQQVADLDVGVAVVAVLDLGALAEQRVGLVEEQDRPAALGRVEDARRFFSVSPMYLLTTAGEVDAVEVEAAASRADDLGRHRLAGAAGPGEQARSCRGRALLFGGEAPVVVDSDGAAKVERRSRAGSAAADRAVPGRPSRHRLDPLRQTVPSEAALRAGKRPPDCARELVVRELRGHSPYLAAPAAAWRRIQVELPRDRVQRSHSVGRSRAEMRLPRMRARPRCRAARSRTAAIPSTAPTLAGPQPVRLTRRHRGRSQTHCFRRVRPVGRAGPDHRQPSRTSRFQCSASTSRPPRHVGVASAQRPTAVAAPGAQPHRPQRHDPRERGRRSATRSPPHDASRRVRRRPTDTEVGAADPAPR